MKSIKDLAKDAIRLKDRRTIEWLEADKAFYAAATPERILEMAEALQDLERDLSNVLLSNGVTIGELEERHSIKRAKEARA